MNEQLQQPGSSPRLQNGPYWLWSALTGMSAPFPTSGDLWDQNFSANIPSGGILGDFGSAKTPSGGILGNLGQFLNDMSTDPRMALNGPLGWHSSIFPFPSVLPSPPLPHNWNPSSAALRQAAGVNSAVPSTTMQATDARNEGNGPMASEASELSARSAEVPFYDAYGNRVPYPQPALPEPPKDFRTWVRDTLSDNNMRYYLGPHLFESLRKLHALTQLLPGSGSVQSMDDSAQASEAMKHGDYGTAAAHLGMGTVNVGLDWLPAGKMLAILGGTMAKTFPWTKLPTAMKMEAAGKSPDEIWRATGLERAADQRWTFEIPDRGYTVRPEAGEPTIWRPLTLAPLYEHHAHPGMRKAYPNLANWPSELIIGPDQAAMGLFHPGERLIVQAPDLATARRVGIHELQHAIEMVEKNPPGGTWKQFMAPGVSQQEAVDTYKRLIGEVVARNAQARLGMSERERRLRSPQSTESVPRDRQINHFEKEDEWP